MTEQKTTRTGVYNMALGAAMLSFSPVFYLFSTAMPTAGAFYRMFFGGVILFGLMLIKREKLWIGSKQFALVALCGFLFALDLFFWHKTILFVGAGLATLLGNFQVFILAGYAVLVLGEKPGWRLGVAIPLAIFGLAMILGFEFDGLAENTKQGLLYGGLTALSFAMFLLVLRKTQKIENPLSHTANIAQMSLFCSLFLAGLTYGFGETLILPGLESAWYLLLYGIFGQVFGHIFISKGLSKTSPSIAGLLHLLQPALVYIWDIVIFSKPVIPLELAGFIVTLTAVYLGSTAESADN